MKKQVNVRLSEYCICKMEVVQREIQKQRESFGFVQPVSQAEVIAYALDVVWTQQGRQHSDSPYCLCKECLD